MPSDDKRVEILTTALERIIEHKPELVEAGAVWAETVKSCPDCQKTDPIMRSINFGLCSEHYRERMLRERENERREAYQHYELRDIAREALEALRRAKGE